MSQTPVRPRNGGIYMIRNTSTNTYVDLLRGAAAEGTTIQGATNINDNHNRLWKYIEIDGPPGRKVFELMNLASGTYAAHSGTTPGARLFGSRHPSDYRRVDDGPLSSKIRVVNRDLSWNLGNRVGGTPVLLQDFTDEQDWQFIPARPTRRAAAEGGDIVEADDIDEVDEA